MYLFKKAQDHEFWANANYPQRVLGLWSNYAGALVCTLLIVLLATVLPESGLTTFAIIMNAVSVTTNLGCVVISEINAFKHRKRARDEREEEAKRTIRERRTDKNSLAYAALESRIHLTTGTSEGSPDDSKPTVCLETPGSDQETALDDYFWRAWLIEDALKEGSDESLHASAVAAIEAHAATLVERLQFIESNRIPSLDDSDADIENDARRFRVQAAIDQSFMQP